VKQGVDLFTSADDGSSMIGLKQLCGHVRLPLKVFDCSSECEAPCQLNQGGVEEECMLTGSQAQVHDEAARQREWGTFRSLRQQGIRPCVRRSSAFPAHMYCMTCNRMLPEDAFSSAVVVHRAKCVNEASQMPNGVRSRSWRTSASAAMFGGWEQYLGWYL
jgi:hypothetical protein